LIFVGNFDLGFLEEIEDGGIEEPLIDTLGW